MLILATANPHKVAELRDILAPIAASRGPIVSLADLDIALAEPAETGDTFEANATIKALDYARQIAASGRAGLDPSCLVLADDSGIEVDALRTPAGIPRPGVISSHYATGGRETGLSRAQRDAANNARILDELRGLAPAQRTARFICVMALAHLPDPRTPAPPAPPPLLHLTRGSFEGRIGAPPRVPAGDHGFGYDPLFLIAPQFTRTAAELDPHEKNARSHRAAAAAAMLDRLRAHK